MEDKLKEAIEKRAKDYINDREWGYPVDETGQWMFDKLLEYFVAGYEQALTEKEEGDTIHNKADALNGFKEMVKYLTEEKDIEVIEGYALTLMEIAEQYKRSQSPPPEEGCEHRNKVWVKQIAETYCPDCREIFSTN